MLISSIEKQPRCISVEEKLSIKDKIISATIMHMQNIVKDNYERTKKSQQRKCC